MPRAGYTGDLANGIGHSDTIPLYSEGYRTSSDLTQLAV